MEIDEKYNLEIALEIITDKIAIIINEMLENKSIELKNKFDYLVEQKNQIYLGNCDVIQNVLNGGL